jgi:hypothetical protein
MDIIDEFTLAIKYKKSFEDAFNRESYFALTIDSLKATCAKKRGKREEMREKSAQRCPHPRNTGV